METILEMLKAKFDVEGLSVNDFNEVRLEETHQTLGRIIEGESQVIEHIETLTNDKGEEWNGVDVAELYNEPHLLMPGLSYLGNEVWFQRYY